MQGEVLLSGKAGCEVGCEKCSLFCATLAAIVMDCRREYEALLREISHRRRPELLESLRLVEKQMESSSRAFARARPDADQHRSTTTELQTFPSALLH